MSASATPKSTWEVKYELFMGTYASHIKYGFVRGMRDMKILSPYLKYDLWRRYLDFLGSLTLQERQDFDCAPGRISWIRKAAAKCGKTLAEYVIYDENKIRMWMKQYLKMKASSPAYKEQILHAIRTDPVFKRELLNALHEVPEEPPPEYVAATTVAAYASDASDEYSSISE